MSDALLPRHPIRAQERAFTPGVLAGAALLATGVMLGCSEDPLSSVNESQAGTPGVTLNLSALPQQPGVPPVCEEADAVTLVVLRGDKEVFTRTNEHPNGADAGPGIPSSSSCAHTFELELDDPGRYTFQARVSGGGRTLELGTAVRRVEDGFDVRIPLVPEPALVIATRLQLPEDRLGKEPRREYEFSIDNTTPRGPILANDTMTVNALAARERNIELRGFSPCDVNGFDVNGTIAVRGGADRLMAQQRVPTALPDDLSGPGAIVGPSVDGLPAVTLDVDCYGDLAVSVTTIGNPIDLDGYEIVVLKRGSPEFFGRLDQPADADVIPNFFVTDPSDTTDLYTVKLDAEFPCSVSPPDTMVAIRPDLTPQVAFRVVCREDPPMRKDPNIIVIPDTLDFKVLTVGKTGSLTARIFNVGLADLRIDSVTVTSPEFSVSPLQTRLAPGASRNLTVSFSPPAPSLLYKAFLRVFSNDPDTPVEAIQLCGEGSSSSTPRDALACPPPAGS